MKFIKIFYYIHYYLKFIILTILHDLIFYQLQFLDFKTYEY